MPRPKNTKKPRPLLRNAPSQHIRPPGLKGREIGLYYKSLRMKGIKENKELTWIHLRIPHAVIVGIYRCLENIEKVANDKNIYLPPSITLEFVTPPKNLDFIPIKKIPDSERLVHAITNIHKKDDDVVFIKAEEPEAIEISDTSSEDIAEEAADIESKNVEAGIFVSNNYSSVIPSNSNANNLLPKSITNTDYKYGYDDIITGTFQEKLDECVTRGIEINEKNQEIDKQSDLLKKNHLMLHMNHQYKQMLKFRETLPTYKKAGDLLNVINSNQVVVISGETGCGKSTQVPQLILDEAISKGTGANVKILVTEPRRIAASSLALRVAQERGENLGKSVGYAVRLEAVKCRERGSIMFCTTGVLLVELEQNQALSSYTHVILDEVHERDCQIDLAMCMLKQVLKVRKDLKLILMSATIDAESLSKYFDDCPMLHIEGLAYPVKDIYLEDILKKITFTFPPRPNFQEYQPKPWHKYVKKHKNVASDIEKDLQYKASIATWLQSIKATTEPEVYKLLQDYRLEELNMKLIVELLRYICRGEPGAILVFVPGISDINKLMTAMEQSKAFPKSSHDIYALHSKLPTINQNEIFKKPPCNVRKIIIATNIAETSITIDDIVYVVDCGRMKYKGLNVEKNLATLQTEWVSKANLRQRRGRAGRCQPGICYHLITSYRAEMLADRLLPELQRSNLLEEVLVIKKLRLGKAEEALKMMAAVPAEKTIQAAVKHLQQIGALDENETLTPLGWHLARLPVHPAAGKLLLLGTLFGCLNRAASVAAVWGFKEPFQLVIGKEQKVDEAKREFAMGEPSDHIALSEAIMQWEECDNDYERRQFAYISYLSHVTMKLLSDMKNQFADNLKQMGFLSEADVRSPWANRNNDNFSLFKAIVAASLYPNIASVKWLKGRNANPNKPMRIQAYTPEDGKVAIHPSSIMCPKMHNKGSTPPITLNTGANWLVYWLKQKSTDIFLLDVTCVHTLPLLFFGDLNFSRAENPDECMIAISSFKVCCKKETAQLLFRLRSLLDQVLTTKISYSAGDQSKRHFELDEQVIGAVIDLITAEDEGTQYLYPDDDEDNYEPVSNRFQYDGDEDTVGAVTGDGQLKWYN